MTKRYLAVASLALALLIGACGDGDPKTTGVATADGSRTTTTAKGAAKTKSDPQSASLAYVKCLRANGVDMPDPDPNGMIQIAPGGAGPGQDEMQSLDGKCKAEREALQGSMGEPDKDFQDKALKMSRCMREQGIDMPDPKMENGGGATINLGDEQLDSPEFKKAQATCSKQVGMPEPGAPAGSKK